MKPRVTTQTWVTRLALHYPNWAHLLHVIIADNFWNYLYGNGPPAPPAPERRNTKSPAHSSNQFRSQMHIKYHKICTIIVYVSPCGSFQFFSMVRNYYEETLKTPFHIIICGYINCLIQTDKETLNNILNSYHLFSIIYLCTRTQN